MHYTLCGVLATAPQAFCCGPHGTCSQVRRTYKKLALQLHPDKAASAVRLAPRCAGCGSAPFEALAAQGRLQERATWLFKLLGEAAEWHGIGWHGVRSSAVWAPGWRAGWRAQHTCPKASSVSQHQQPPCVKLPCPSAGEANDVLSDASKRRELDAALRAAAGGSSHSGRGGFGSYSGYGAHALGCLIAWLAAAIGAPSSGGG